MLHRMRRGPRACLLLLASSLCFAGEADYWRKKVQSYVEAVRESRSQLEHGLEEQLRKGGDPAAQAIVEHLLKPEGRKAGWGALIPVLASIRSDGAGAALGKVITKGSVKQRAYAVRMARPRHDRWVRKALEDVPRVRVDAAAKLARRGDDSVLGVLLECARLQDDEHVAQQALLVLPHLAPNGRITEFVLEKLSTAQGGVLSCTLKLAAWCDDDRVRQAVVGMLGDEKRKPYRKGALKTLIAIGDESCVGPALDLMEQGEDAAGARLVLVSVRSVKAVDRLVPLLTHRREWVRREAGAALRGITGEIFPTKKPEVWKQWWAERREHYLGNPHLPYPKASPEERGRAKRLANRFAHAKTRDEARKGLVELGAKAIPAIRRRLLDRENCIPPVWGGDGIKAGIKLLATVGQPGLEELGRLSVLDGGRGTNDRAWKALVEADRRFALQFLLRAVKVGGDYPMAPHRLAECCTRAEAPLLREIIVAGKHPQWNSTLIPLLVKLQGDEAVLFLAELARDAKRDRFLRVAAMQAIAAAKPANLEELLREYLLSVDASDMSFRAGRLAAKAPRQVAAVLTAIRDGQEPEPRRAAAALALVRMRRPGAVEALAPFLRSDDKDVRYRVLSSLDHVQTAPLFEDLVRLAQKGPEPRDRSLAARALAVAGKREAVPMLVKLLRHDKRYVVESALGSLDRLTGLGYAQRLSGDADRAAAAAKYEQWWRDQQKAPGQRPDAWQEMFWAAFRKAAADAKPPVPKAYQPKLLAPVTEAMDYAGVYGGLCVAAFGPKGEPLVFEWSAAQGQPTLVAVNGKTRRAWRVAQRALAFSIAFSPDGRSLALAALTDPRPPQHMELRIVSLDTTQSRTLAKFPFAMHFAPSKLTAVTSCVWLDDHTLAAYVVRSGTPKIVRIDARSGEQKVMFDCATAEQQWPTLPGTEVDKGWTPVGEHLSATLDGKLYFAWKGRVFCTDAASGKTHLVADCPIPGGYSNPRVAPDGRRLLLQGTDLREAYFLLFDADLSRGRVVTMFRARGPVLSESFAQWFPDGKHVAVTSRQAVLLATRDGRKQAAIEMSDDAPCVGIWPLSNDALAILTPSGIWRLDVAATLRTLDASRAKPQRKYPDLSSPEAAMRTYFEAMRRADEKTAARCCVADAARAPARPKPTEADKRRLLGLTRQMGVIREAFLDSRTLRFETVAEKATLLMDEQRLMEFAKVGNEWKITPPKKDDKGRGQN